VIVHRQAARALLLTPDHEILLMRIRPHPDSSWFWIAPGGGIEPGETIETALRRELNEEVSLLDFSLGPLVWRRQHTFDWQVRRICQREQYFVVHVTHFAPQIRDPHEAKVLDCFRWWQIDELASASERLTPLSLPNIIANYLARGAPPDEPAWEVLVD